MDTIDTSRRPDDLTHEDIVKLHDEIDDDAHHDAELLEEKFGPGLPTGTQLEIGPENNKILEQTDTEGADIDDVTDEAVPEDIQPLREEDVADELTPDNIQQLRANIGQEAHEDAEKLETKFDSELPPKLPYDKKHQG